MPAIPARTGRQAGHLVLACDHSRSKFSVWFFSLDSLHPGSAIAGNTRQGAKLAMEILLSRWAPVFLLRFLLYSYGGKQLNNKEQTYKMRSLLYLSKEVHQFCAVL